MAKITISEFARFAPVEGAATSRLGKPISSVAGTTPTASSAQTPTPDDSTRVVRLCADVALHVGYGAAATVADDYYPAGAEIVRQIEKGQRLSYLLG